jgi:D-proline reductase (dithiol) PrdB
LPSKLDTAIFRWRSATHPATCNAAARPKDLPSQAFTLELALKTLEAAPAARTTVQSPLRWSADSSWKLDYSNIARLSAEEIQRLRAEFDRQKEIARSLREPPDREE